RFEQGFGFAAEGAGFLDEFLGLLAVVPEIVSRHQGVNLAQTFLGAGHVKETSADGPVFRRRSLTRLKSCRTWRECRPARNGWQVNRGWLSRQGSAHEGGWLERSALR